MNETVATFERHPAFARGADRARQCAELNKIRSVLPTTAPVAAAWVWTAILDERAVLPALRALDEMPQQTRIAVFSQSRVMM